jgi:hypothetical protein
VVDTFASTFTPTFSGSSTATGDATPPTPPTLAASTRANPLQVNLSWSASSDQAGIAGYDVFKNGVLVAGNIANTSYNDLSGLNPATNYTYQVRARDNNGNASLSNTLNVTTPIPPANGGPSVDNISSWNTVEVRGTYRHFITGRPYQGSITFTLVPYVYAPDDNVIIPGGDAVKIDLDSNGSFTARLPATNDPDTVPNDFKYLVTEQFVNSVGRSYLLEVPLGLQSTGIDLSDVAPAPVTPQQAGPNAYPTLGMFADLQRLVDTVLGGGVFTVNGKTGVVSLTATDVGADESGAAAGALASARAFATQRGLPAAGPARSVLTKASTNDWDSQWSTALDLPGAGDQTTPTLMLRSKTGGERNLVVAGTGTTQPANMLVVQSGATTPVEHFRVAGDGKTTIRDLTSTALLTVNGDAQIRAASMRPRAAYMSGFGTTTSLTYTGNLTGSTAPVAQLTCPASLSGVFKVTINARLRNSEAAAYTIIAVRITRGDGTTRSPVDDEGAVSQANGATGSDGFNSVSSTRLYAGYTPGESVTFMAQYKVTGGTGSVDQVQLIVEPTF